MPTLTERLDQLKQLMQDEAFLEGRGLSNEVNIRIFCYDPCEEMTVVNFIQKIKNEGLANCNLIECNLYSIFLSICEEKHILDKIPQMESRKGSAYLLKQLQSIANDEAFVRKIQYAPHAQGDVLLLTGVGDVFPFMRVHILLEALQPHFSDIPILVMYPGVFDGHHLKLFNRLQPSDYYRAFNTLI